MDVNHKNYEEYILDYLEGNLTADDAEKVEQFFNENPSIYEEVKDLDRYVLPAEEITYLNKQQLIKNPKRINIFNWGISGIAAALALLMMYMFLIKNDSPQKISADNSATPREEVQNTIDDNTTVKIENDQSDNKASNEKIVLPKQSELAKENTVSADNAISYTIENQLANQSIDETDANSYKSSTTPKSVVAQKVLKKPEQIITVNKIEQTEAAEQKVVSPVIMETLTANQSKSQKEEETEEKEKPKTNQAIINSITNNIEFAENKALPTQEEKVNDGFAIETIPDENDIYVSTPNSISDQPDANDRGILTLISSDKEDIKKALTPKSFGISIQTKKKETNSRIEKANDNNKLKNKNDE